jgi:hypothetical protein
MHVAILKMPNEIVNNLSWPERLSSKTDFRYTDTASIARSGAGAKSHPPWRICAYLLLLARLLLPFWPTCRCLASRCARA